MNWVRLGIGCVSESINLINMKFRIFDDRPTRPTRPIKRALRARRKACGTGPRRDIVGAWWKIKKECDYDFRNYTL